jgi:D-3-phosphoglycerate dehydrogenase
MKKVLITARAFGRFSRKPYEFLEQAGCLFADNPWPGQKLSEAQLLTLVDDVDALICGEDDVSARVIESAKKLKVISKFGVGVDKIDVAAASARKIAVCNTPGANSESVADMAFCLMLGIARQLPRTDGEVRQGLWQSIIGCEIFQKTIGIVGLGRIGKAVARRAQGFSMKVLGFDEYPDRQWAEREGVSLVGLDELLREADFVSLHLPGSPGTRGFIGAGELARMKPTAYLINTARGEVVDEEALFSALQTGKLAGAGLDVFAQEPPEKSSPLLSLPNVVLAPHVAAHTVEAINNMGIMSAQNAVSILERRNCEWTLNSAALAQGG